MKITKVILLLLLIVSVMGTEVHTMPTNNNSNNKGGNEAQKNSQYNKVPAWLSGNKKTGFSGVTTGSGTSNKPKPSFTSAIISSMAAANTNGGGQWLAMDNKPVSQPAYVNPPKPTAPAWMNAAVDAMAAANTNGGGQWLAMDNKPVSQPAYTNPVSSYRPPAYGGGYNPTKHQSQDQQSQDQQQQSDQQVQSYQDTYNSYQGQPVNYSYSDLLRNIRPFIAPGTPGIAPLPPTRFRGFGSSYGGNWGGGNWGGGGGGGGWGGGGGYSDTPAWLANLYLNSWNIR